MVILSFCFAIQSILTLKSTPIVAVWTVRYFSQVNLRRKFDFPTAESPIIMILTMQSKVFMRIIFYSFQFQNLYLEVFIFSRNRQLIISNICSNNISCMSSFRHQIQQLEFQNAKNYINDLQMLEVFVKTVPIRFSSLNKTNILNEVAKHLLTSFNIHKSKVLKLWIHFIQRANNECLGITAVHLSLLSILKNEHQYKLALKIVGYPGLPINISSAKYQQYLVLCADVYNELEKYSEALECLTLANSIQSKNFQLSFMSLKLLVLTLKMLGNHFDKRDFQKQTSKIKNVCYEYFQQIKQFNQSKMNEFTYEYHLFTQICDDIFLDQTAIQYLKSKQFHEIYQKILQKKMKQLLCDIKKQIANPTIFRVKQDGLKDVSLHKFQILRDINKIRPLYKSDQKNKIIYFQHFNSNQSDIDDVLNKACILNRIIENRPLQTIKQDFNRFQDDIFDRIRRFGGLLSQLGEFTKK